MSSGARLGLLYSTLLAGFALCGLWWWVGLGVGIAIVVLLLEWASILMTGKTLSNNFLTWVKKHPYKGGFLLLGLATFIGYLIGHLRFGW